MDTSVEHHISTQKTRSKNSVANAENSHDFVAIEMDQYF